MTLISLRRPKLEISALRSYRAPKYPRAGEELDFDLGDISRWPFAPALASAVLATTLASAPASVAHAGGKANAPATRPAFTKTLPNPFAPKERKTDFGGKGGPMTMPREMALVAIAKGFEDSGIKLKPNVDYREAGVRAELDGYDAKKSIGFEIVSGRGKDLDKTLQPDEVERLDKDAALQKRQIAIIHLDDVRFTAYKREEGAKVLTKAVQQYVDHLRSIGAF